MKKKYHELDDRDLARIVYMAHLGLRIGLNQSATGPFFDALDAKTQELEMQRVRMFRRGATPAQVHQAWVTWMEEEGWELAVERNVALRQHPDLVSYEDLPPEGKAKLRQARRIVFSHVMPQAVEPIAHPDLKGMEPMGTGWRVEEEELPEACVTHGNFYPCGITDGSCVLSSEEEEVREVYRKRYER